MNQEQVENEIKRMTECEFLDDHQLRFVIKKLTELVKEINDLFGYNDGEPLDEDGVKFITEYLKLQFYLSNAIYEES